MSSADEVDKKFNIFLWTDVQNMAALKQAAVDGLLNMALVNPAVIFHSDQILVAIQRSLLAQKYGHMKTKNVFTEILYSLSPSKNIKDAFKTFGVEDSCTSVVTIVSANDTASIQQTLSSLVQGNLVKMEMLPNFYDSGLIKKTYKIQNLELGDEILSAIIGKIAIKGFI